MVTRLAWCDPGVWWLPTEDRTKYQGQANHINQNKKGVQHQLQIDDDDYDDDGYDDEDDEDDDDDKDDKDEDDYDDDDVDGAG